MRTQHTMIDANPAAAELPAQPSGVAGHRTAYLWLDAAQSWPLVTGTETISNRALCAGLIVVAVCAGWAAVMMASSGMRPAETTAQIELLAHKLERKAAIPPETASELARLVRLPAYDCRQVPCSAELTIRNEAARSRLQQLLASKGPANDIDLSATRASRASAAAHTR
jgi:hypothetical protein